MTAALRALLTGLIDYAGLFPPACLPLPEALANFAHYLTEPEAWMLGRFVCPASRLAELAEQGRTLFGPDKPLRVAALGRGGATSAEFLESVRADGKEMRAFGRQFESWAQVDVYEARLPAEMRATSPEGAIGTVLASVLTSLRQEGVSPRLFFEMAPAPDGRAQVDAILAALKALSGQLFTPEEPPGFKLRCGGEHASAVPPPAQVAYCLHQSLLSHSVPFKATAGLHHPLRRFDPVLQTPMHGFVNLFGAGVLAGRRALHVDQIRPILEDEEAGHFSFTEEQFRWGEWSITTEEINELRRQALISFGSCSFDEPRADLRTLGWL